MKKALLEVRLFKTTTNISNLGKAQESNLMENFNIERKKASCQNDAKKRKFYQENGRRQRSKSIFSTCEYFRLKDDIEEKEEKLQEKFERALRQRKPRSAEQLLKKPRKSVLERVNKKRDKMERKAQKRAIKLARRKRIKAAFEKSQEQ